MPLNLGNINKTVVSDQSFEDAYIEFLEADQQFVNLTNAIEIAEKAKESESMECIRFAEELLGISLEAENIFGSDYRAGSRKQSEIAGRAIDSAIRSLRSVELKCKAIKENRKLDNLVYKCPEQVIKIHNHGFMVQVLDTYAVARRSKYTDTRELSLRDTALIFEVAARRIAHDLSGWSRTGTEKEAQQTLALRKEQWEQGAKLSKNDFPDPKREGRHAAAKLRLGFKNHRSVAPFDYKVARRQLARFLVAARAFMKFAQQASK